MSRILKDLPWENIIAATLAELEEEARAYADVNQFNVEDEFEAEDVLEVLIQQIQNFRPDLPRYVASNMVNQLFRGNRYVKTPKGSRPLSKTARRGHVADLILRQLALQMGAHDPEFDISQVLNVNYSLRPRAERRAEVEDDGLTVLQRVTRSFGTDDLEMILPAYHAAFGNELNSHEVLLSLFESFREKAFFYSPVLFVADIENIARPSLSASLSLYLLNARFERLDAIDKTCLLLRAYLDLKSSDVPTIDVWNELLRNSIKHSDQIRSKLNIPLKSSLQGLNQLDKPRFVAASPETVATVSQPEPSALPEELVWEDALGMDDIGEMVAWLQWTFENEISLYPNLSVLMDDLIYFEGEQLAFPVAIARIKVAAAQALEISQDELDHIYHGNFSTRIPFIELAFYMMALIRGKSLLSVDRTQLKSIVQDATFRMLQRMSDARHDYQSETRMVEQMLIVEEDPHQQNAEVYDLTTEDAPVLTSVSVVQPPKPAQYSYPIQPQPWHRPRMKYAFANSSLQPDSLYKSPTSVGLGISVKHSPEIRSMLQTAGLTPVIAANFIKTGFLKF